MVKVPGVVKVNDLLAVPFIAPRQLSVAVGMVVTVAPLLMVMVRNELESGTGAVTSGTIVTGRPAETVTPVAVVIVTVYVPASVAVY